MIFIRYILENLPLWDIYPHACSVSGRYYSLWCWTPPGMPIIRTACIENSMSHWVELVMLQFIEEGNIKQPGNSLVPELQKNNSRENKKAKGQPTFFIELMHFTAVKAKACCVDDVTWYDKFTIWNNLSCHDYEGNIFQTLQRIYWTSQGGFASWTTLLLM